MSAKMILVVEDDALHRRVLGDILRAGGYEVTEAENREVAIETAVQQKPELVLLNAQMTSDPGIEIVRALRADQRSWSIPIIALTVHARPGQEQRLIEAGCNAHHSRPISVRDLLVLIETFLSRPIARVAEAPPLPGTVLPRPGEDRWPFRQKAVVVYAVRRGLLSIEDACERYRMSLEEFATWERAVEEHGAHGLRITRTQLYRDAPRRRRIEEDVG
ncbi:MAG: DUF1153 domain-containing protein [Alphaproteobacteria bacterium]|nr:DUF1153 domain-containing protein [Alphaproteobacteria bacterium]